MLNAKNSSTAPGDSAPLRALLTRLAEGRRTPLGYLLLTTLLMVALWSVVYHSYDPDSWIGTLELDYLEVTARASALVLTWLGEEVTCRGTEVLGRFHYVVVVDCAALDAQALLIAAVAAFPCRVWKRLVGIVAGALWVFGLNVTRLVVLYFAGAESLDWFHWLHEEVLVFAIILGVTAGFGAWVLWARERATPEPSHVV